MYESSDRITRCTYVERGDLGIRPGCHPEGPLDPGESIPGQARTKQVAGPLPLAAQAFEVLGKPAKISRVPEWLMWSVVRLVKLFNRHQGDLLAFFTTMATSEVVAPQHGNHPLDQHYRPLVESPTASTGA